MKKGFDRLLSYISGRLSAALNMVLPDIKEKTDEIRIRCEKPVCLTVSNAPLFVNRCGTVSDKPSDDALIPTHCEVEDSFLLACGKSVHSHIEEISQGFVTLPGGDRVGLCGTAVMTDSSVSNISNIYSLNYRISREIHGAADGFTEVLRSTSGLLICGPPSSGKTTSLRDAARSLASGELGKAYRVSVIDSGNEIASVVNGVPQNDVGICTDILSGYDKAYGIISAIRTLNPEYLVVDEIMNDNEVKGIIRGSGCGVRLIATMHCGDPYELAEKEIFKALAGAGAINDVVYFSGAGRSPEIFAAEEIFNKEK